jgi:ketosteroid isomerase-like protein
MPDRSEVQRWLDAYVAAWTTYDPAAIGDLFAADAVYYYFTPFAEPIRGRDAIVKAWLDSREPAGTYAARYEPVAVDGDVAVAQGRTRYFTGPDRAVLKTEWDNVFVLRFDAAGRCVKWREWNVERPEDRA